MLKSAVIIIGHISLWMKLTRKPSSGNPNAGFEVAGAGNILKLFVARQFSTLLRVILTHLFVLEKTIYTYKNTVCSKRNSSLTST